MRKTIHNTSLDLTLMATFKNAHLRLIIPGAAAPLSGEARVVAVTAPAGTPLAVIPHLAGRKVVL